MEQHLARDLTEFGRSGRRYPGADILAVEVGEIHATQPLRNLQCRRLTRRVVLVTNQPEVDGLLATHSSTWRLTEAGWRTQFHQGTPTTAH